MEEGWRLPDSCGIPLASSQQEVLHQGVVSEKSGEEEREKQNGAVMAEEEVFRSLSSVGEGSADLPCRGPRSRKGQKTGYFNAGPHSPLFLTFSFIYS